MFPEERRTAIIEILNKTGRRRVVDLAKELSVSEVTVRQDLDYLEQQGLLRRAHGGAIINPRTSFELPFQLEETAFSDEKERIGKVAASLITNGETIILDVGTTVAAVARHLGFHQQLTVLTNALNIAMALENYPEINLLVTGGTLRSQQHSLVNPYARFILEQVRVDIAVIGVSGVSLEYGFTNVNIAEAEMKELFIKNAERRIVVADSSKIGKVALARVAKLTEIDILITDQQADPKEIALLREQGLEVILA